MYDKVNELSPLVLSLFQKKVIWKWRENVISLINHNLKNNDAVVVGLGDGRRFCGKEDEGRGSGGRLVAEGKLGAITYFS